MTACAVDTCDRDARTRGWCDGHYCRWKRYGDVRADVPLRPARTPYAECGTPGAYNRGCRCDDCREANRRRKRDEYQPRTVPAVPVVRHLTGLIRAGMSRRQIAARSALPYTTVAYVLRSGDNGRVFPETADALLAVKVDHVGGIYRPTCEECGDPSLAGGRWCLMCFNARSLPQTKSELDEVARRRFNAVRKRRQRAARTVAA